MSDRLDLQGKWWFPGREDQPWSGRLVDDPDRGVTVSASAPDQMDLFDQRLAPMVLGRTVDQLLTLTHVELYPSMKLPGGTELRMRPWQTFVGAHFEPDEEITFDRFTLRVGALDEWANRSGFEPTAVYWSPRDRIEVVYERPEPLELAKAGDVRIRLRFKARHTPRGVPQVGVEIRQEAEFEFVADEPMRYEELESMAQHVRNFVIFASRQWVDVAYSRGFVRAEDREGRPNDEHEVEIVSRHYGAADPGARDLDEHGLLFRRDHNGEPPGSKLDRWLHLQDEEDLGLVVNLYLAGLYQPKLFVEFRVLALAQAADSLHARRFDAQLLPTGEHRANVAAVLKSVSSDELREWAKVRLEGANRKTYYDALVELVGALPSGVRALLPEPDRFAAKVKTTRNYLTHWNPDLRAEAATTLGELDGLAKALRCFLEALLLLELGFTADEADALVEKNLNFRRELSRGLDAAGLS